MAYKEILVHLDNTLGCATRIEGALALAKRYDGRVRGVALALKSTIASYVGLSFDAKIDMTQQSIVASTAERNVADFEQQAKATGVDFSSQIIRCAATNAPAQMAFHARHADISFFGQPDPEDDNAIFLESLYEGPLFASGRPLYLVPHFGKFTYKHRKAVLAWDGGAKSARAIRDAIPLLQGRGEVQILIINPHKRMGAHGEAPGTDLSHYLNQHGIDPTIEVIKNEELSTDTLILNHLTEVAADLLVMGAYSHSRLREKAFGGVTESILHQMTTPVLMSA